MKKFVPHSVAAVLCAMGILSSATLVHAQTQAQTQTQTQTRTSTPKAAASVQPAAKSSAKPATPTKPGAAKVAAGAAVVAAGGAAVAAAAALPPTKFPEKQITIVIPYSAGGPTDKVGRDLAQAMTKTIGASVVVENAAGAGSTIGSTKVARASKDGYTLLLSNIAFGAAPSLYRKLQYKPLEDFEFAGVVNDVPMTMIVRPDLPVRDYKQLEHYVRTNAEKINIGHAGIGSASHTCSMMWQKALNLPKPLTSVPFGGTAPAMNAMLGGHIDVMCDQTTNTTAMIASDKVKAFAVTTLDRLKEPALMAKVPTLHESGLKNFNLTIWHGLYAPKGTPPEVMKKINDALKAALKDPEFVKHQQDLGAVVPAAKDPRLTPAGHKAFVAEQIKLLKDAVDAAGQYAD